MIGNGQPAAARIVDRGYQHYDGQRLGAGHAVRAMIVAAMRRAMGIRRSTTAKLLPWLLVSVPFLPVIVVQALHALTPGAPNVTLLPYRSLYAGVLSLYVLFAGYVAPDLLCADRRERVLSLYFASPITRVHYVIAQNMALVILLLLMTLAPALLLFGSNSLLAASAMTYLHDNAGDLWRLVVSGILLALYFAAVSLAVAAFTDRRAYASGAFIGLMLVSTAASGILVRGMHFNGHLWFALLDLPALPVNAITWIYGATQVSQLDGWIYLATTLVVGAAAFALLTWRYLTLRD